jgi:ribosome-associated protein
MTNLTHIDLSPELKFQTTRSGGSGGQNVNKVETAVIASFHIESSLLLTDEQKKVLQGKLYNRINTEGFLLVRSQAHRTQLENKEAAEIVMIKTDMTKKLFRTSHD